MSKKLAIKGHPTRGKEVIELLKMLGGRDSGYGGLGVQYYYYISQFGNIEGSSDPYEFNTYIVFTLEEFLEKYPFKVGDKVFDTADGDPGTIAEMKWDKDVSDMKYRIAFDNGDMGWFTIDTFGFLKKDKNLELEKMSVKNHKMGPKSKLPSKYYEDRLKEIQTKRDMDNTIFMIGPVIVPDKVDDKLEYKIPDDYEFDVVVDGKIILKPIKPKYPTTYEDCCKVLDYCGDYFLTTYDNNGNPSIISNILNSINILTKLLICRDAYWKIAGEKMGLDKPWKPQFENCSIPYYCIFINHTGEVCNDCFYGSRCLLAFPSAEMRDAFYKNFKDLIEQCKELL